MKLIMRVVSIGTLALLAGMNIAWAMDGFEIQVYDSDIDRPGQYSLETHLNSILVGKKAPAFLGGFGDNHMSHMTFEFARGMTPWWEAGLYVQSALPEDGIGRYGGMKLRSKFVKPKSADTPYELGVNVEIAGIPRAFEEDEWGSEIRPIFGYNWAHWTVLFNPIVGVNLTPGKALDPDFSPALKASYATSRGWGIGLEYYADLAAIKSLAPLDRAEQYLFAAADLLDGGYELNLGVGGGLNHNSNSTVVKGIVGFGF